MSEIIERQEHPVHVIGRYRDEAIGLFFRRQSGKQSGKPLGIDSQIHEHHIRQLSTLVFGGRVVRVYVRVTLLQEYSE